MTVEDKDISEETKPAVEEPSTQSEHSGHLVCRSGWALIATAGCGYFAYLSYSALRSGNFDWQHSIWNGLTWAVWMILGLFLLTETRCRLERILFTLLLLIFAIGMVFSFWNSADLLLVREARIAASVLWSLAALVGLISMFAPTGRDAAA